MEGEVVYVDDPRFSYGTKGLPDSVLDMSKLDYTLPTRCDLYKEKLPGFSDLALEIIEIFESKTSNNDFKRRLKALHRMQKNIVT